MYNISAINTTALTSTSTIKITFSIQGITSSQSIIMIGNNLIKNSSDRYSPDIMFYCSTMNTCGIIRYVNNNENIYKKYPSTKTLTNNRLNNGTTIPWNVVITLNNFGAPTIDPLTRTNTLTGVTGNTSTLTKLCNLSMTVGLSTPPELVLNNVVTWYNNMDLNNVIFYNGNDNRITVSNLNITKTL
jgi:hypothetical protein